MVIIVLKGETEWEDKTRKLKSLHDVLCCLKHAWTPKLPYAFDVRTKQKKQHATKPIMYFLPLDIAKHKSYLIF